jgi:two-component system phosphate regulon sensor histidine kinase PhoR
MERNSNARTTFAELIDSNRKLIMDQWAQRVSVFAGSRGVDKPALQNQMGEILGQLSEALRTGRIQNKDLAYLTESFKAGPTSHGIHRVDVGFDLVEVVAEYNVLRDVLRDLGEQYGVSLAGDVGTIANRVISDATALAVESFVNEKNAREERHRLEQFSFMMHDLKTPLTSITIAIHALELILAEDCKPDQIGKIFDVLRRNAQRMDALLTKSVSNQKLHEMKVAPEWVKCALRSLVQSVADDLRPLAEANRTRLVNAVSADLTLMADPVLLRATYQNLISNAIRYTHRGEITVGADAGPAGVESWVADTGQGIAPEFVEKVFEKFETTGHARNQQGLGLAIVKQAVEAHGGTVTADSRFGAGSTFRFFIPAKKDSTAA